MVDIRYAGGNFNISMIIKNTPVTYLEDTSVSITDDPQPATDLPEVYSDVARES